MAVGIGEGMVKLGSVIRFKRTGATAKVIQDLGDYWLVEYFKDDWPFMTLDEIAGVVDKYDTSGMQGQVVNKNEEGRNSDFGFHEVEST